MCDNAQFSQLLVCCEVGDVGTWRLASLVVHVDGTSLIHPGHHKEVGGVEAVDTDDAGLGLHVGVVRVGGIQVVLKDCKAIQVLDLTKGQTRDRIKACAYKIWFCGTFLQGQNYTEHLHSLVPRHAIKLIEK